MYNNVKYTTCVVYIINLVLYLVANVLKFLICSKVQIKS